jgi:glycosyltransferase involved in cell wall biosynthesis
MRILQVTSGYHPAVGGLEVHVQTISEALISMGHTVTVATPCSNPELPPVETLNGVTIYRFPALGSPQFSFPWGMARFLIHHSGSFDIIHAHNYGGLPLGLTLLFASTPTVISPLYHGRSESSFARVLHRIYDPLAAPLLSRAKKVICLSAGEAVLCVKFLGINPGRIAVVPSPLPRKTAAHPERDGNPTAVSGGQRLILTVGRLVAYKRVERIIRLLPLLPADFVLGIVGDGPERGRLKAAAARVGVSDRVIFFGFVSQPVLEDLYRQAHVLVNLSTSESFGRTILEGLVHGCQVICSDIPAFGDFAQRCPQAVRVVPETASPAEIAALVQRAASVPPFMLDLEAYQPESVACCLLEIYREVCTGPDHYVVREGDDLHAAA